MDYFPSENVVDIEEAAEKKEETAAEKKKSIGFAVWNVGDTGYKMKLNTAGVKELERRYKTNIINMMQPRDNETIPPLTTMLDVTQVAMRPWNHGIKTKDVESLFDRYMADGGSQLDFYASVYVEIFMVSGFFSRSLAEDMSGTMAKSLEEM